MDPLDPARPGVTADLAAEILGGRTTLGIELGSTRIKAVLIGSDHRPLAVGTAEWENQFVDRVWTYSVDAVWAGLQQCYAALAADVRRTYAVQLASVGGLGISAMMHGYLALDADGELLTPFRTWRNTNTGRAADALSAAFGANIPHRWSVAHLYQAVLDDEPHVPRIAHLTTLAGYVHWRLSGQRCLGVGDASGMFPIDSTTGGYDAAMLDEFDRLTADSALAAKLADLLPPVLVAGREAGALTADGALLLDPTGGLAPGAVMCPPEGDAGTGMVATNSVAPRTGNVSAGTSIFAMAVLEGPLGRPHREVDLVTTPAGDPVAMVHCNNGASELNAWAGLFAQFARAAGTPVEPGAVFEVLLGSARDASPDGGGLMAFNYLSGEPITDLEEGRPLFFRTPGSALDLGTFVRTQLYAVLATLRLGMDVLQREEGVELERLFAHGGLFKTAGVAQAFLAGALDTPVAVGDVAAEGGAWGIAVLAAFSQQGGHPAGLAAFLDTEVFADAVLCTVDPQPEDVAGFDSFMKRYVQALPVVRAAVSHS
ncbi:xylulokinase [Knoellia sp. CPCC 206453]|uniref:xylulokinase n=1 Tax=Knoellia pratensis TaxID=3404796 RepID=UPI00360F4880